MAGRWIPVWLGLGSNLDDPAAQLHQAMIALRDLPDSRFYLHSRLYRNKPMGPQDQPDYVNAVAGLLTRLPPRRLLEALQALERAAGRDRLRSQRWGPRRLDLDILSYGQQRLDEDGLSIPHPGISERNFVLLPLLEVAPGLQIPGLETAGYADRRFCRRQSSPAGINRPPRGNKR